MPLAPVDRRRLVADTGIALIAASGTRGLTHRAVDAAAGLPAGSTSYYFRTRRGLLEAVVARLADLNLADTAAVTTAVATSAAAGRPIELADVAEQFAAILDSWLVNRRDQILARYACMVEAASDARLHGILASGQPFRDEAAGFLATLGAAEPHVAARHLLAFVDGLLLDRLAGTGALTAPAPGTAESRRDLTRALRAAVQGLLTTE